MFALPIDPELTGAEPMAMMYFMMPKSSPLDPQVPVPDSPIDVQIHPRGEIYLCTPTKRFQVFSPALRLASPVFSRMLDPTSPFLEGRQLANSTHTSPAAIPVEDDDPDAMEVILNIAHHNGHRVPKKITAEMIFAIAALCDKYDMGAALSGWAGLWTEGFTVQDVQGRDAIRWLALACAFRDERLMGGATEYLIRNVRYKLVDVYGGRDEEGDGDEGDSGCESTAADCRKGRQRQGAKEKKCVLAYADGTELCTDGIPRKVLDALEAAITSLHHSLRSIAYQQASLYILCTDPICKHKSPACDRLQLGTLMRFLSSAGMPIFPLPPPPACGANAPPPPPNLAYVSAEEVLAVFSEGENLSPVCKEERNNLHKTSPMKRIRRILLS